MTTAPEPADEPDWRSLPHDPQAFFGLSAPWDERELKRRYHRLIKRYKPEKHPEEFQRIRAAFEALERPPGGAGAPRPVRWLPRRTAEDVVDPVRSSASGSAGGVDKRPATRRSLARRLRDTDLATLLEELASQPRHTEEEQVLLAFLREAAGPDATFVFLDGLLEAVRSRGTDHPLRLLDRYLRSAEAGVGCRAILPRVFAALDEGEAFAVSPPLWDALLERCGFPAVLEVWDECLRHLPDPPGTGRIIFEMRLVERLLFSAPVEWTRQQLSRLTRGDVQWPDWLDARVFRLGVLADYVAVRTDFLERGEPVRLRIDAVIAALCRGDHRGPALLHEANGEFLRNFPALSAALPREANGEFLRRNFPVLSTALPPKDSTGPRAWAAWAAVCEHAEEADWETHATDGAELIEPHRRELAALPDALNRHSTPLLGPPRYWTPATWVSAAMTLVVPPLFCGVAFAQGDISTGMSLSHGLIGGVFGAVLGSLSWMSLAFVDHPTGHALCWENYIMGIRPRLVDFLTRFPLPIGQFLQGLRSLKLRSARGQHQLEAARGDIALKFFATAAWLARRRAAAATPPPE